MTIQSDLEVQSSRAREWTLYRRINTAVPDVG